MPRTTRTTVDGQRIQINGTRARLDHHELGDVERVPDAKPAQWTATAGDGRTHTARSRQAALAWLLEQTADQRAAQDAQRDAERAQRDAEDAERDAEERAAQTAVIELIRATRPEIDPRRLLMPFDLHGFTLEATTMYELLSTLAAPGPRVLPIAEAVKHLDQRSVVLCHRDHATAENLIPDTRAIVWGFLADAVVVSGWADQAHDYVDFAFEADGRDADGYQNCNTIQLPVERTAVVARDAVTFTDPEGGYLIALTPDEGGDDMEVAGLDGISTGCEVGMRDWAEGVLYGSETTYWDLTADELAELEAENAEATS